MMKLITVYQTPERLLKSPTKASEAMIKAILILKDSSEMDSRDGKAINTSTDPSNNQKTLQRPIFEYLFPYNPNLPNPDPKQTFTYSKTIDSIRLNYRLVAESVIANIINSTSPEDATASDNNIYKFHVSKIINNLDIDGNYAYVWTPVLSGKFSFMIKDRDYSKFNLNYFQISS